MGQNKQLAQLRQLQQKLGYGENAGTPMWAGKSRKEFDKQKKYMNIYGKLQKSGADMGEFGTFDLSSQVYSPPGGFDDAGPTQTPAPGAPPPDQGAPPPDMENPYNPDPNNPSTGEYPYGPSVGDINQTMATGLPPGININTTKGAQAAEVLFPYVKQMYDVNMDKMAIESGARSIDDYKNDPTLQKASEMTMSLMNNPYTFDDQTVSLMENRIRDQTAADEAAMGDRLRSMGVTLGTDSPAYANLASQASMVRDINRASMERDLDIQMAQQRMTDRYKAAGAGGQFGGAYQAGLGGRYQGLAGIQQRRSYGQMDNPFSGLWQGMMMQDEMGKNPSFAGEYGGMASSGLGLLGQMPWQDWLGSSGAPAAGA